MTTLHPRIDGVVTIGREATARDAARRMRDAGVGALVVLDDEGSPQGVVTDRDLALHVLRLGLDPEATPAIDSAGEDELVSAPYGIDIHEAARRMRAAGVRRLPLVDADGRATAIVTADDVLCAIAEEFDLLAAAVGRGIERETDPDARGSSTFGME